MSYTCIKPMKVQNPKTGKVDLRNPGDPVPEADDWVNAGLWVKRGFLMPDDQETLNASGYVRDRLQPRRKATAKDIQRGNDAPIPQPGKPLPGHGGPPPGLTEDMQFIFGKSVLIVYAAPRAGLLTPTAGYTFAWVGLFGAGALGTRIMRFRMDPLKSDRVEGEMSYDQKVVSPEMGAFLTGVIS